MLKRNEAASSWSLASPAPCGPPSRRRRCAGGRGVVIRLPADQEVAHRLVGRRLLQTPGQHGSHRRQRERRGGGTASLPRHNHLFLCRTRVPSHAWPGSQPASAACPSLSCPWRADLDLGLAVLEVEGERHEREAALLGLGGELVDLLAVQQQLAGAARGVVGPRPLGVFGDVDVDQPRLAVLDRRRSRRGGRPGPSAAT